ncbi:uncharacterized protein LOC133806877 [Humulus lupulus]|uniref:uncharacterized protein LOC133806877 n=1 Tax=Humulus lupulus TaxID=3486 RepID=UPI002B4040F9|nr:uncharacterized protein LOC133806877 [Humulus lupulus]
MESIGAPGLRTAFQAKNSGTGLVVKRPRVAKKATPTTGNTSKSPAKGKDTSSAREPALMTSVTVGARNEELQAELDTAKVTLNVAQEGEQATKAALTAAQKNEHAAKAALTSSQEIEQAAKTALSTSQAQTVEANHRAKQLQVEIGELKEKLLEAEVKSKEEKVASSSAMVEMLYHCWAFYQDGNSSFMELGLWDQYLAKFKDRFLQEPWETGEVSGVAEGDGEEVTSVGKLNQMTIKNKYPVPKIYELFDQLVGSKFFFKIDLRSGYHQLRIKEEDILQIAFRRQYGDFEFLDKLVAVFIDDILVYSKTPEDHVEHLAIVLQNLRVHQIYAKKEKRDFWMNNVKFLGHVISQEGIIVDHAKIDSVLQWERSKNVTKLTRKDLKFMWDESCEEAFRELKQRLRTVFVLTVPISDEPSWYSLMLCY